MTSEFRGLRYDPPKMERFRVKIVGLVEGSKSSDVIYGRSLGYILPAGFITHNTITMYFGTVVCKNCRSIVFECYFRSI